MDPAGAFAGLWTPPTVCSRLADERSAALEAWGLLEIFGDWIRVRGRDRHRFLNGLVTCDLRELEAGAARYGFLTDPKGKILASGLFLATSDELWIELPPGTAATIQTHASRYVVTDDVALEAVAGWAAIRCVGPERERVLTAADGFEDLFVGPAGRARTGLPSILVAGPAESVRSLAATAADLGAAPIGGAAATGLRVERGVGLWGVDFDRRHFPQETGLEDRAVSYQKGCYLGQEVVARIHYRGKVNRRLVGLEFDLEAGAGSPLAELDPATRFSAIEEPAAGDEEGSEAAADEPSDDPAEESAEGSETSTPKETSSVELGSWAWSAERGAWLGLAVAHRHLAEGARLRAGELECRVVSFAAEPPG